MRSAQRAAVACGVGLVVAVLAAPALPAVATSGSHVHLAGSMEGDLAFPAGSWVSAGYHFKTSGTSPVTFAGAQVSLPVSCSHGGSTVAGTIVVPLQSGPYQPNGTNWTPWLDQSSKNPLPYQGAVQAPDYCHGGPMYNSSGASFDADLSSNDSSAVAVQFHYRVPAAKGKGNVDCNDPNATGAYDAATCGASESPTGSFTPTGQPQSTPQQPPTQTLSAVIYECVNAHTTTTTVPGGDLSVPDSHITNAGNPMSAHDVTVGNHTVDATVPSGWVFVDASCAHPGTTSTDKTVNVPSGGSASAVFYAEQPPAQPAPKQTLAAVVYQCVNGVSTSTVVPGAELSIPDAGISNGGNDVPPVNVSAGDHTVTVAPPAGWTVMSSGCDHTAPTQQTVTVPSGGDKTVIFYAAAPPSVIQQTLSGVIYRCDNGSRTTDLVPGGSLSASGPDTVAATPNPLPTTSVAAGGYTMSATVPNGWTMVSCGQPSAVTVTSSSTGSQPVTVPAGGFGRGVFYAQQAPPLPINVVVEKTNDANKDNIFHKSEIAQAAGEDVTFDAVITNTGTADGIIASITDLTNGKTTPVCADLVHTTVAAGASVTCTFTLPDYAPPAGAAALVDTVTATLAEVANAANTVSAVSSSTVFPPVLGTRIAKGTPGPAVAARTQHASGLPAVLPFTGGWIADIAWLGALLLTGGAIAITGARRRTDINRA